MSDAPKPSAGSKFIRVIFNLLMIAVMWAMPWLIRALFMTNRGDLKTVFVGLGFALFAAVAVCGHGAGMLPGKGRMIRKSEQPVLFYVGLSLFALCALGMYAFYVYLLFC